VHRCDAPLIGPGGLIRAVKAANTVTSLSLTLSDSSGVTACQARIVQRIAAADIPAGCSSAPSATGECCLWCGRRLAST
jgi:hypothetical protein